MTVTQRKCSICHQHFPEEVFASNGRTKAGSRRLRSWCKLCESKRVTAKRKSNPYTYVTQTCHLCDTEFKIRVAPEPAAVAVICKNCSQNENEKRQEATNASNKKST